MNAVLCYALLCSAQIQHVKNLSYHFIHIECVCMRSGYFYVIRNESSGTNFIGYAWDLFCIIIQYEYIHIATIVHAYTNNAWRWILNR